MLPAVRKKSHHRPPLSMSSVQTALSIEPPAIKEGEKSWGLVRFEATRGGGGHKRVRCPSHLLAARLGQDRGGN